MIRMHFRETFENDVGLEMGDSQIFWQTKTHSGENIKSVGFQVMLHRKKSRYSTVHYKHL